MVCGKCKSKMYSLKLAIKEVDEGPMSVFEIEGWSCPICGEWLDAPQEIYLNLSRKQKHGGRNAVVGVTHNLIKSLMPEIRKMKKAGKSYAQICTVLRLSITAQTLQYHYMRLKGKR